MQAGQLLEVSRYISTSYHGPATGLRAVAVRLDNLPMPLTPQEREQVLATALELLRHKQRDRLLQILADRLAAGDYPDDRERDLDEIACALARAVDEQLPER